MPSDAADAVDARQSMPGEGLRGSGVQTQPGGDGRLASASFDPVNEGGLQQTAATNDVRRGDVKAICINTYEPLVYKHTHHIQERWHIRDNPRRLPLQHRNEVV